MLKQGANAKSASQRVLQVFEDVPGMPKGRLTEALMGDLIQRRMEAPLITAEQLKLRVFGK